jgi:hypothetical protein
MELGSLRAQALDLSFAAHAVPATVTRPAPDDDPIETRVLWVTPVTEEAPFAGGRFARREPRRIAALRRDQVATVPVGTAIVAPEKDGDDDMGWRVEGIDRIEADHYRVVVVHDLDVFGT